MRRPWTALSALVAAVATFALCSSPADARRGIALITHGQAIAEIGPVVESQRQYVREATGADAAVGYIYESFGVFWLDLWTWDGRYCLTDGDTYWELDETQAASLLGSGAAGPRPPLRYSWPPGLVVALALALGFGGHRALQASREGKIRRLFEDPRYRRALEIMAERRQRSHDALDSDTTRSVIAELDEAVSYLSSQGIARGEAEANLQVMVDRLAHAGREAEAA
ncbi:MAG: hypothetical protein GY716_12375 [bacterium]|nr:hypothetical protein [bacterium]